MQGKAERQGRILGRILVGSSAVLALAVVYRVYRVKQQMAARFSEAASKIEKRVRIAVVLALVALFGWWRRKRRSVEQRERTSETEV